MKHLHGETMEAIIERLKAHDPATVARFTYEYRAHLFLQILDAMRYAHSRGVIHRDLKPANIMIGEYGEVTVMDWGIAKPIGRKDAPADSSARSTVDSNTGRLLETQIGTLAGTPLYMSPEQAAGRNDELDERSDVYALSVVFYEWMALQHPIEKPGTLLEILGTIATQEPDHDALGGRGLAAGVPAELLRFVLPGLVKDPKKRFSSVAEMEKKLRDILDGRIAVSCHLTLTKRSAHEFIHWVDRHPHLYSLLFVGTIATLALSLLGGIGAAIYHWLG
jgi:serine/threonine-protein kinase